MLTERERIRLSKKMTGLLRHYGDRYGLRIDKNGWVRIEDLVRALRSMPGYEWVEKRHVMEVVRRDDKGRYEIKEEYIRARYGHSMPHVSPEYEEAVNPPSVLYHGTPLRNLSGIMTRGLLPGKRHWVHLTTRPEMALETGRRYGRPVVLLEIDTSCLERKNITLFRASEMVILVRHVPPECIKVSRVEN